MTETAIKVDRAGVASLITPLLNLYQQSRIGYISARAYQLKSQCRTNDSRFRSGDDGYSQDRDQSIDGRHTSYGYVIGVVDALCTRSKHDQLAAHSLNLLAFSIISALTTTVTQ